MSSLHGQQMLSLIPPLLLGTQQYGHPGQGTLIDSDCLGASGDWSHYSFYQGGHCCFQGTAVVILQGISW